MADDLTVSRLKEAVDLPKAQDDDMPSVLDVS